VLFPVSKSGPRSRPIEVVITGAGIITAFGSGWKTNSAGFREGRPAFRPVTLFDTSRQRAKFAAEVDLPEMPKTKLTARHISRMDRASKLLLVAGEEAWRQSGWSASENLPMVLGTTSGGMTLGQNYFCQAAEDPKDTHKQCSRIVHYQCQRQAMDLADAFGFSGPITLIANACASGANAVGHAFELIRSGQANRVLTGGFDALSHLVFSGFDSLQALSTTTCRPFDTERDGLALGEGAAVLTLESLEYARKRGAEILGQIIGYGATTDCHHLTQPHPQGEAACSAMSAACNSANISPEKIGYINAHGTGTPLNDSAEAFAINRWANGHAQNIPVSSTKASVGHLLGAAGAVEALICAMALREQWLPPTITTSTQDTACNFSLVRKPADARFEFALSNSFGFGGANASLIFRRYP
jgi:3-oxoacyl-[acyl-carrier-protein] synthase II